MTILFTASQSYILDSSKCIVCISGSYEFNDILSEFSKLVSSAYKIYLKNVLTSGMSFMYIRKRSGPNIDPCGTPVEIIIIIICISFIAPFQQDRCSWRFTN